MNIAILDFQKNRRRGRAAAVLGFAVAGLSAFGSSSWAAAAKSPPVFTSEQADQGKTVYTQSSVKCHGANLSDGEFGPSIKASVSERR